eukprot:CAMPEP_0201609100 /NCGR_PEP_ID=MMETSP0492-20130828/11446_1 /ASSEMBLY_ACC=CAM_ASM_000837 /TAXON_ID=420259 /ORGANISM="Thalassiosira gravida, Strain GMp14c1" /LENGTH=368 /DNA_ID=CAMNT_0048074331 /DNA_START=170 /DNA_END=1276 /DNA_ORIENTATION=+
MAGVSGGLLAAEVTKAGGLGMIAAGHFQDVETLESEIEIFEDCITSSRTKNNEADSHSDYSSSDMAIGFIGFSSFATPAGWENYERILKKYRPKAVQCFAPSIVVSQQQQQHGGDGACGLPMSNVQLAHEYGAKFIAQVGSIAEAKIAIRHDVDAIICQGSEAGGHGLRRELGNSTLALASQVKSNLVAGNNNNNIPVLAAGGIVNGKHVTSMLCVCDGVSMGTRYWACKESLGSKQLQNELIRDNSCDDAVRTTAFDQIHNELASSNLLRWQHPYDSSGTLRNKTTEEWDDRDGKPSSKERLQYAIDTTQLLEEYKVSREICDATVVPVYAGQGVGEIDSIEGAYDITLKVEEEVIETMDRLRSLHC